MPKTQEPEAPVAPAEPVILNADTAIETNNEVIRQPFQGTKVETFDAIQTPVYKEPDFEEVEIRPGVFMRTYTGVQPGVTLTDANGKDLA